MSHGLMEHDALLVGLAFVVAYFASFTALDMGTRLRKAQGKARQIWLAGSGFVLGGGIWSMHFLAMLGMHAGMPVGYDVGLTAFSLGLAIGVVALGFHIVTRPTPSFVRLLVAGTVVGIGVALMHYVGMAALIVPGQIVYNPLIVALSVGIAIVATTAALWLTLNLSSAVQRVVAAGVMAVAVCGMHFTGMAGTTIQVDGVLPESVSGASNIVIAEAVIFGIFLIISLAIVCVFVDRRLELIAEREASGLREANARLKQQVAETEALACQLESSVEALSTTRKAVQRLLDHADQGFLTIGRDLVADPQASAACEEMLGRDPVGVEIGELLMEDRPGDAREMAKILESVFDERNSYLRELKIELLPATFAVGGKSLSVSYKFVEASGRLMLVITDVTEKTRLAEEVARERRRLELIVHAATEGEMFDSVVEEFRLFATEELPQLAVDCHTSEGRQELFRPLHTYKGLLSQYGFHWTPRELHDLEQVLAEPEWITAENAVQLLNPEPLLAGFERDMSVVSEALRGTSVIDRGERSRKLAELGESARLLLSGPERDELPSRASEIVQSVAEIGMIDVKAALELYGRGVPALGARLNKFVRPVVVNGDDVALPPERFANFCRSLVHVFRNAVDHGVELPGERIEAGKPDHATIEVEVREEPAGIVIEISDDGRGVDRTMLELKLMEAGVSQSDAESLSLTDLVFREGLSCREDASDISGRGVGLAAIRNEVEAFGGSVGVQSQAGVGTTFRFTLPRNDVKDIGEMDLQRKVAS